MTTSDDRGFCLPQQVKERTSALAITILFTSIAFGVGYLSWLVRDVWDATWPVVSLMLARGAIEAIASVYAVTFLATSMVYAFMRRTTRPAQPSSESPRIAILYLCCGDLDADALRSLAGLDSPGPPTLVIHDDATGQAEQASVDEAAAKIRRETGRSVLVMRRAERTGGKPGAVNFVLEQIANQFDWVLLCDNDSIAIEADALPRALAYASDPTVAVVQCRTIGVSRVGDSHINRLLVQSIDAFHVFLQVWARFGWMPFIGHNALLRMSAVRTVGGFTPGCFADDVDITVRLNLAGYRVVYAPDVRMAETHPASYRALRKRSYKWAYGCIQALKAHAFRVVSSRRLTVAEKLGFFQFTGFYVGQALVLMYLMLSFVVAPLLAPSMTPALLTGLVLGAGVAVGVYIPVVVYFWREGRLVRSFPTVLLFGLTYGATDFACTRGVWDSIRNRVRSWIPTNVALGDTNERVFVAEAAFGAALLLVPLWFAPGALWVPSAYLFGGKFLFSPALARWYDPRQANRRVTRQLAASLTTACLIALVGGFMLVPRTSRASSTNTVEVRGKDFVVDGQPFSVKGVHYGPWRPGTGPGRHYPYPDRASVEADLEQIVSLNANTILVFDAPGWVLDVAHAHGLRVLYTIRLNWQHLPFDENLRAQVAARVQELRSKPALLAWLLGNEVPSAALNNGGAKMVSDELATLYQVVKTVDSVHPISHSNWVTTKDLDLRFLDFVSFNVYPLWPPQVVALGYDHYIERVLRPIAGDKLLLMTEFGVNTIEAGEAEQAAILTKTWEALRRTDAAGGVVMEFADEWWKNYDNPRDRRDWWDRTYAPHDELTQDNDPEEAYGLVTAQRVPKLAFAAVQQMFADQPSRNARTLPALIVLLLISVSSLAWLLGRGLPRLGSRNETPTRLQGRL